jgi:hypothetical protein
VSPPVPLPIENVPTVLENGVQKVPSQVHLGSMSSVAMRRIVALLLLLYLLFL